MRDKFYFSDVPKSDEWVTPNSGLIVIIPKRWWNIKDWFFLNDFIRHHQIYFLRKEITEHTSPTTGGVR